MAKKISVTVVAKQVSKGSQSVTYEEILSLTGGRKVRISIKSDAYVQQSHARAHLWNGEKWNEIHHVHPAKMKTPHALYVRDCLPDSLFLADREELLRVADTVTKP
jgi:hypothetical protein